MDLYRETVDGPSDRPLSVLFVVEDKERNVIDQKVIEHNLYRKHKIFSIRCNFECISKSSYLDPDTNKLTHQG